MWGEVGADAVELVSQCLERDAAQRLDPKGVLIHRWVQRQLNAEPSDEDLAGLRLKHGTDIDTDTDKREMAESPPSPSSLKHATEALRRSTEGSAGGGPP